MKEVPCTTIMPLLLTGENAFTKLWFLLCGSFVIASSQVEPNNCFFCCSNWLSQCKIVYYTFFSWMYGFVGSCAHLAMVNSSWTQSHIEKLWRIPDRIKRVYPPCDTSGLQVCNLCFIISMDLCNTCTLIIGWHYWFQCNKMICFN